MKKPINILFNCRKDKVKYMKNLEFYHKNDFELFSFAFILVKKL
jgi:hypothetical protein